MQATESHRKEETGDKGFAFVKLREQYLTTLNLTIEEYEHCATGARHYHFASDNPENVFLVAFRTVPMDSTGVAHILEHTALCGSRKFPVRDPFFMMIRRSMNTFMNAFTSSDWTAYPFASQNKKDFNNLLEVYLDAVFFSNLNPLDFAQEGHRLEFATADDPSTSLEYKGVVFNEMKGAMSSPNSAIWQLLCKHLFPTSTYHYNSGGDPSEIPELSYDQLKNFYKTHYHPSNSIFMTFGNIPAQQHQIQFQALALQEFDKLDVHIAVEDEQRYPSPIHVTEHYALDEEDITDKEHIVLAWLLGYSTELEDLYKAQLLSSVLLDNSASPLLQVLETTDLARSPSPLCGLEDSYREMSFICGLEACKDGSTDEVENLILGTLEKIAAEGIEQDKVEAALHNLELSQREISGDTYPYGLQLILAAMSTATHRGDPIRLLDIDPVLNQLKEDIKDPDFIPGLIRTLLLNNTHRITLTVIPDARMNQAAAQLEASKLEAIHQAMSNEEKQKIVTQSKLLADRQNQEDDVEILPKVEISDVPVEIQWPDSSATEVSGYPVKFYDQGTNGISYQQLVIKLPTLSEEDRLLLPYYTACLPELGVGAKDYLQVQALQSSISGGVHAHTSIRSHIDDEQSVDGYMVLGSKSLYRNQQALSCLLKDTLQECRFDELQRIKEIIEQICSHREQSITSQGHTLAMGLASSKMSPLASLSFENSGLAGITRIKALAKSFADNIQLQSFAESLQVLHKKIVSGEKQFLLIGELNQQENLIEALDAAWEENLSDSQASENFSLPPIRDSITEAWITSTQVNFCALAFPTVSGAHKDAAALTVLGGFLRNGFLHKTIREQGGAYGGGAAQDSSSACFRFFSYRDPRLTETLSDFKDSIEWMLTNQHNANQLEEAVLGVISSLDKPASPAGTARQAFYNELFGRSKQQRAEFRQKILDVSIDDLAAVTKKYLDVPDYSTGIITNKSNEEELEKLNFIIKTL